jgi:hypothetical protein
MITKINARKIKYQPNIRIFVWDYDNLIKKKNVTNYKDKFKTNQILKDEIEKKGSKGFNWTKNERWNLKVEELFDIVIEPDPTGQP